MTIGSERYGSRTDTVVFVVCVVLSLVTLALPEALRLPVASALRRTVLLPVVTAERQAALTREERQDVLALRAERDSLALAAVLLPEVRAENAQLRALLRLSGRLGHGYVGAEVLHQTGLADGLTLLLSAGRRDGVELLAPVVAPAGLVGAILSVEPRTSVAMAWSHPDFRVSAMVGEGRIFGIVAARRGERAGEVMELTGIAYREHLPVGTPVVTSGLGGIYPRGIPVGTVQGVLSETAGWERTYLLRPAIHPAQASHVMVLRLDRAADTLAAAFDTLPAAGDSVPPPPSRQP